MIPLFSRKQYSDAKTKDVLLCKCENCDNSFYVTKHDVQRVYNNTRPNTGKYCSKKCQHEAHGFRKYRIGQETGHQCKQCDKPAVYYSYETTGDFCSKQCAVTYSSKINKEQQKEKLRRKYGNYSGISLKDKTKPKKEKVSREIKIKIRKQVDKNKRHGDCKVSFCQSCKTTIPNKKVKYCDGCNSYNQLKLFYSKLGIIETNLTLANQLAVEKFKNLYFDLELSKIDLQRDYNLDTKSIYRFATRNGIKLRTLSESLKLAFKNNKFRILNPTDKQFYKSGFYTGSTGSVFFLRSGYEFVVAEKLDELKINYDYEQIKIPYTLSGVSHWYITDFYLPEFNIILEPKSNYFFKIKNNQYYQQYLSSINCNYELHYLFDKDINKFKSIDSFEKFYNNNLVNRKYF